MQIRALLSRKIIIGSLAGFSLLLWLLVKLVSSKDEIKFVADKGDAKAYSFSYTAEGAGKMSSELMLNPKDAASDNDTHVSAAWEGIIKLEIEAAETDFTDVLMEITSSSFKAYVNQTPLEPIPTQILGKIRFDKSGHINRYTFSKVVMDTHGSFLGEIMRFLDVRLPLDRESSAGSEELWPGFRFPVSWDYKYAGTGTVEIVKSYDAAHVEGTEILGDSRIILASSGVWYESIDGNREKTKTLNSFVVSKDTARFNMKINSSLTRDIAAVDSPTSELASDDLRGKYTERMLQVRMNQDQLGDTSADEIKVQLEDAEKLKDSMPVYLKLKALLFLYPGLSQDFMHFLIDNERHDIRFTTVATALTSVGHKEAQEVLQKAIEGTESDLRKHQALIPHLGMVREPTLESQIFLERLSQSSPSSVIRATAELSLGIMAGNIEPEDATRAGALTSVFIDQINQDGKTPEQIVHLLSVLGNSGHGSMLDTALKYCQDNDPKIRQAAYHALRDVKDVRAFQALLNALQNESYDPARETAARSLRKSSVFVFDQHAFMSIWSKEKNLEVLRNLILTISDKRPVDKNVDQLLLEFQKDCGRTEICSLLQ